ncbi:hypothetical protein M9H77_04772 [Catharanthus roseus]|uniref:Uncharacterized protein n=1 Tax=Catharanthus roseus TaxID=4058 RepID=A0ACC0CF76_CATRO|nr:hypothetical protein M9H77_04772 [Catharanthus roseus]
MGCAIKYVVLLLIPPVPNKYTTSLRRLKKIGCKDETRLKKYNIPLLEVVRMTSTSKNFTVATTFMRIEQAMTYRWVLQQIKHLYFSNAMSTENEQDVNTHEPKLIITDRERGLIPEYLRKLEVVKTKCQNRPNFLHYLFTTWLNLLPHKFVRCWTKRVMYFGVETTNSTKSEHSVLKLWLSTCHGDLDTVFLNIYAHWRILGLKKSLMRRVIRY